MVRNLPIRAVIIIALIAAAAGWAALAVNPTHGGARPVPHDRCLSPNVSGCRLAAELRVVTRSGGGGRRVRLAAQATVTVGTMRTTLGFELRAGSAGDYRPVGGVHMAGGGDQTSSVTVNAVLAGLTPGAIYELRVVAHNAAGWRYSAGHTVTANGGPSALAASVSPSGPESDSGAPSTAVTHFPYLWGAQIGTQFTGTSAPWDMNAVSDFATMVGKAPSVVPFNIPFENCDDPGSCYWYDFPATQMSNVTDYGALTMLNWSSMSIPESTSEPAFTLADVANGDYDSYIRQFAAGAAAWGHPFLLRFDWEMNGNWFPWDAGANGNDAADFVAAWRHVHDIFTAEGATNASWVWCPNVDFEHKFTPLSQLYPGSAYVDWTCLDGYNFGNLHGPGGWMSFNQIFSSTYKEVAALAPDKPMIIGETASSETGGSKAAWITDMFNELPHYPNIHGLVYYDQYDGGSDWPLETSLPAIAAFKTGIGSSAFTTNTYAGLPDGPIQPPG